MTDRSVRFSHWFVEDLHWNVVGHRLAAAAEWLKTIGRGRPR